MTAILPAVASAATSAILGSVLSGSGTKTKKQKPEKFQREIIDQLLAGLQGGGPFADLFSTDPQAFKTSVSDPLMQQFSDITAPGIQQRFIASGQHLGTPIETALSRAGTDVQSQINQLFLPFLQGQQQRSLSGIQSLLGIGAPQVTSSPTALGGALSGLASSGQVPNIISGLLGSFGVGSGQPPQTNLLSNLTGREGFAQ